ncbi:MAG TPA: OmpH family outer membrane protein [Allosphingosinicella sp.]|jgi:Skp family chaperone for outer membrane proteins
MTKTLIGAALVALALAAPSGAVAQRGGSAPDVLVVDIGRISTECNACRAAATNLQSQQSALQQRQQQLQQQLQTTGGPIQTAVDALAGKQPDPALQARIRAFETQRNQAAQEIQSRGQQIESIGANVNIQIDTRLRAIVEQIRAQHNAAVVVAKGATWASNPSIDVTNEALAALNQQLPSVSLTPLPQTAQPTQPQGR